MDKIIKEEVDKGHSFYMIVLDHPEFNITERTLYYYQEKGYLSCKNIDLPRIVRYRKRKRKVSKNKSERKENECRCECKKIIKIRTQQINIQKSGGCMSRQKRANYPRETL